MSRTRRLVFVDIDGTLAHHGLVPGPHVHAVRAARAAGHRVLLCTGRPASMIPAPIRDIGFDGIVASAGAYVEVREQVLLDTRFPGSLAAGTVTALDRHDVAYWLEAPEACYAPPSTVARLRALHPLPSGRTGPAEDCYGLRHLVDGFVQTTDPTACSFAKLAFIDSGVPVEALQTELGPRVSLLRDDAAVPPLGEVSMAGITKATGATVVQDYWGIARDDVVAVGDGLNDVELLEHAGIGIAVEDAAPRVLAVADTTMPPPARAGLAVAFLRIGLLATAP